MDRVLNDFSILPNIGNLKRRFQSLAMLDAILMPDWEMRYFSFNSKWGEGEMMASMRDGEGSEFFFLFNRDGVAGKIYHKGHALGMDKSSALAKVPADFASFSGEPAFAVDVATCYLWRRFKDGAWSIAPDTIREVPLLAFVADEGEYYRSWAQDYYEMEFGIEHVAAVFRGEPLTDLLVTALNPEIRIEELLADCREIDYPMANSGNQYR